MLHFAHRIALVASIFLAFGCGGGGGGGGSGDEFNSSADVSMSNKPSEIDPGDRTRVTIRISNVNPDGILLKIRYSDALDYVPQSSFLKVEDSELDLSPAVNELKNTVRYLVYFLSRDLFGEGNEGTLRLDLVGLSSLDDGEIQIDPDVDDPQILNSVEFNTDSPGFTAEDSVGIVVRN